MAWASSSGALRACVPPLILVYEKRESFRWKLLNFDFSNTKELQTTFPWEWSPSSMEVFKHGLTKTERLRQRALLFSSHTSHEVPGDWNWTPKGYWKILNGTGFNPGADSCKSWFPRLAGTPCSHFLPEPTDLRGGLEEAYSRALLGWVYHWKSQRA